MSAESGAVFRAGLALWGWHIWDGPVHLSGGESHQGQCPKCSLLPPLGGSPPLLPPDQGGRVPAHRQRTGLPSAKPRVKTGPGSCGCCRLIAKDPFSEAPTPSRGFHSSGTHLPSPQPPPGHTECHEQGTPAKRTGLFPGAATLSGPQAPGSVEMPWPHSSQNKKRSSATCWRAAGLEGGRPVSSRSRAPVLREESSRGGGGG